MSKRATGGTGRPDWNDTVGRAAARQRALVCLAAQVGVIVHGEAGIGKSRFAAALIGELESDGRDVIHLRATTSSSAVPLGAFSSLLADVPAGAEPVELLHQLRMALARRAAQAPLALAVDDVHLLDEASAMLLHHLARSRAAAIVMTCRDGEPLPGDIESLRQDGIVADLRLDRLEPDDARALVVRLAPGLPDRSIAAICRAAEGVPLFLVSLVADALEAATAGSTGTPAPAHASLVEAVQGRLGRLDDDQRRALELVSLSEPLELPLAERIASPSTLVALEARGLLHVVADGKRQAVRLAHPLFTEGVLETLPQLRRRAHLRELAGHRRELSWVRRPDDLLRLVLWQLDAGDDVELASLLGAATVAAAFGGAATALRLARLAWDRQPDDLTGGLLAVALLSGGHPDEVDAHCRALPLPADEAHRTNLAVTWAVALWAGVGDTAGAVDVLERFGGLVGPAGRHELETIEVMIRFYSGQVAAAVAVVDRLLAAPDLSPRAREWALFPGVMALAAAGRTEDALRLGAEARREAPTFASDIAMAVTQAWCVWGNAARLRGDVDGCVAELEAQVQHARRTFDAVSTEILSVTLGLGLHQQGHLAAAADAFAQLQPSPDLFALSWLPYAHAWRAQCLARLGRVDEAQALLDVPSAGAEGAMHRIEAELAAAEVEVTAGQPAAAARRLEAAASRAESLGQVAVAMSARFRALSLEPTEGRAALVLALHACHDGERARLMAEAAEAARLADVEGVARVAGRADVGGLGLLALDAWDLAANLARRSGPAAQVARVHHRAEPLRARLRIGSAAPAPPSLTGREFEIARMAGAGTADKEIAEALDISVRTVHAHLRAVYTKLGIDSRADLRGHWALGPDDDPA